MDLQRIFNSMVLNSMVFNSNKTVFIRKFLYFAKLIINVIVMGQNKRACPYLGNVAFLPVPTIELHARNRDIYTGSAMFWVKVP